MTRFRFNLEPLLTARRHVERGRQRAVATLERERQTLEDALRRQQQFITSGKTRLRDELVGSLDLTSMRAHAGATIRLLRDANRLVIELAGVHRRLEQARAELIAAARERQAIELLREQRLAAWKADQDRRENAVLDDLAGSAAHRTLREGA